MNKIFSGFSLGLLVVAGFVNHASAAGSPLEHSSYEKVKFDSLEGAGLFSSKKQVIDGYLLKADAPGKAPAVILRPACNGLLHAKFGEIRPYHMDMAEVLHNAGITVLMVDGFSPRKQKNICTTAARDRSITMDTRIKDSMGALQYLQVRNDIDASKIFLVTYGATGGFHLMNSSSSYFKTTGKGFAGAVMFFAQCNEAGSIFAPYAPIQVFVGEKDAWNPANNCRALEKRKTPDSAEFNLKVYPDTYHAFVKRIPPREVQGPPGVGRVMAGGNPESTANAYKTTSEFLTRLIKTAGKH